MQQKTKINFSIVIPTLNEEDHLPFLLLDLSRQSFKNFEIIVVDGKSEDKTKKNAEKYSKRFSNFTFLVSEKRNVSYQRNLGAKKALSDWLIFMDADNRLPTYFLQGIKFYTEMQNPDILSTWIEPDSDRSKDKSISTFLNLFIDVQKRTINPYLLESFVCIKKHSFFKLKGFKENLEWGEGNDLLRRAKLKRMKFVLIKNPKYIYSLRRLRKMGAFKALNNIVQIELTRIANIKTPKDLYPMEGGGYYKINQKEKGRLEEIFFKLSAGTRFRIETNKQKIVRKILKMIN